ncbi:TadE family type IV pilus minor pilin [Conyzicola sp.]|uniref:TadE family type IV pilus minor pilin n=1 Tax=Conyzicola sp. TaxID=1969404 RepID=UPI00398A01DB
MHSRSERTAIAVGLRRGDDRGSVTAEFAAVVPAIVLLLACCLAGLQIAGQQLRLQDAAADVSRSVARGGGSGQAAQVGASVSVTQSGDLVCARLSARSRSPAGTLLGLTLTASSCALGGGK